MKTKQTFDSSVLVDCSAFLRAFSASALCRFSRCSASSASRCFSSSSIISVFMAATNNNVYLSNIYRNITCLATAAEHREQKMMLAQPYFHSSSIRAL